MQRADSLLIPVANRGLQCMTRDLNWRTTCLPRQLVMSGREGAPDRLFEEGGSVCWTAPTLPNRLGVDFAWRSGVESGQARPTLSFRRPGPTPGFVVSGPLPASSWGDPLVVER